jgi:hypothetical protein
MGKNHDPGSGINIQDPQHCIASLNHSIIQQPDFVETDFKKNGFVSRLG